MFDYDKIEGIIQTYLAENEEEAEFCFRGGASLEQILNAEKILNVSFPQSYRWFLRKYGSGGIAGINIHGIEGKQPRVHDCTLVYATAEYGQKAGLDKSYIVIESCGDVILCLDISQSYEGECPVISCITHGERDFHKVKDSFYDYFLDKLTYMTES